MKVMPIIYVKDMDAFERFYAALGFTPSARQRNGNWLELSGTGGVLALHATDSDTVRVQAAFQADEPLADVVDRLRAAGFEPEDIVDEAYGHSFVVRDPAGMLIVVNKYDEELYT